MDTNDVRRYIKGLSDLSTLPALLGKILAIVRDENASAHDLHRLITFDQALAQRILRVANSAAFGRSGQIKDIDHAVLFLGFERIKTLAVGMTAVGIFPSRRSFNIQNLWIHGYEVAFLASALTDMVPMALPGECFLAGLLHDVGRLVFYNMDPVRFRGIETTDDMLEQEKAAFGCNHAEAGSWFAQEFGFPKEIIYAISCHHKPSSGKDARELVSCVALGEALSRRFSPRLEEDGIWTGEHDALLLEFGMTDDDLKGIGDKLIAARPEIESMFSESGAQKTQGAAS